MKSIVTEVVDTGHKRDTRGRRIAREEERRAMVASYEKSGMTQKAFAQREGIKFCTFTTWLAKKRKEKKAAFAEVSVTPRSDEVLEVVLPDGTTLRGRSAEALVELLQRLRRC